jgi:hypothetical protein
MYAIYDKTPGTHTRIVSFDLRIWIDAMKETNAMQRTTYFCFFASHTYTPHSDRHTPTHIITITII